MFSKTITSSSQFLMMPPTSRLLYYDLGMNADDDGFCEHFAIMRMTEASPDDLRVLEARRFVKVFDDKVLIIRDWKENNYLRSDRYTPSKYLKIYKEELKKLPKTASDIGIPVVHQLVDKRDTQVRLGKDRLGKVSINKYGSLENIKDEDIQELAEQYHVAKGFVQLKLETLKNYCESKGKSYKNYKSALRNFILGDMQREIQRPKKGGVIDATNL